MFILSFLCRTSTAVTGKFLYRPDEKLCSSMFPWKAFRKILLAVVWFVDELKEVLEARTIVEPVLSVERVSAGSLLGYFAAASVPVVDEVLKSHCFILQRRFPVERIVATFKPETG